VAGETAEVALLEQEFAAMVVGEIAALAVRMRGGYASRPRLRAVGGVKRRETGFAIATPLHSPLCPVRFCRVGASLVPLSM